ncbi:serine/arginine repetitive matrix protein 1-like [Ixodes scapularis]|uniref:serine/arginine repetitive matrix protein 1-like n=1 Tax=Ixodes scapularis TaxID=6945 RepID=UPI001A9F12A5|nr:serine/arginine repetitive matrix protein 1-like [Ixodes scapularis]
MASRRYQPGDRLLGRELGDARKRWESDGYEYDIFPQLPPPEAHPPKRWRYHEQDSPSLLSEAGWEAEDASRRPSQAKQASFWSTPSSRKPATPRGSAARSSAVHSVHTEREPSESSKRADVPEASTSGVGRRPSTPRSLMASRRYQPGDRLLGREPGDARKRWESDGYEYDIFPQLPPREAHPPKRWRYQEQDSPSSLSEAGGEAEDASRWPSQPKQASFWSTPSSRKLATPRGSAARSSAGRSVHAENEPSESSKRADVPEASTSGVGRRPSASRSFGTRSSAERLRQAGREPSPQSSGDDEGPAVSTSGVQRRSTVPEASASGAGRRLGTLRSFSLRSSEEQPRQMEREPSPQSSMDDEGPPVSASRVQRRSAGAKPTPERRPPTPARQAPAQPSAATRRAPEPPAPEPSASKGPGRRRKSTSPRRGNGRPKLRAPPWLKNIRHLQRTTRLLIPRLSFARVVREILQGLAPSRSDCYYMQGLALQALQDASEDFVTNFLSASYLCSLHAKRKTLMRPDMIFLQTLLKAFGASIATSF